MTVRLLSKLPREGFDPSLHLPTTVQVRIDLQYLELGQIIDNWAGSAISLTSRPMVLFRRGKAQIPRKCDPTESRSESYELGKDTITFANRG